MTTATALTGVIPPVCTPLTPDYRVDTGSLTRLAGFAAQNSDAGSADTPRSGAEAREIWNDLISLLPQKT